MIDVSAQATMRVSQGIRKSSILVLAHSMPGSVPADNAAEMDFATGKHIYSHCVVKRIHVLVRRLQTNLCNNSSQHSFMQTEQEITAQQ